MIWIKIKDLEAKISKNELTDKEGFNYLLITVIYGIAIILIPTINGLNYITIIHVILNVLIAIIGLQKLYKINTLIDDKDFLKRYISITWVVRVRLIIYYLLLTAIYIQIFSLSKDSIGKGIAIIVISFIMNVLFYYFSIKSFKRIRLLIQLK